MQRTPEEKPRRRTRCALLAWLLPGALVLACGADAGLPEGALAAPPVPGNLDRIEPDAAAHVREGLELVRADPLAAEPWSELGKIYEVETLRAQAIACYEQALLRDPSVAEWWYRSAICRWRVNDMAGAIADIERAIERAPEYGPSYYRLGTFHLELGELEPAWSAFQDASRIDPAFQGGWVGLARVHLQRDEADRAVALLEGLRAKDPLDDAVNKLLQTAYRQAGRDDVVELASDAEGTGEDEEGGRFWRDPWQVALKEVRRAPQSHKLGRMLERGREQGVIRQLERRRRKEPETTDFLPQLAEAYFQAERLPEARQVLRDLLALEPDNVDARLGLARFQEAEGYPHLALPWLDEVIRLQPELGVAWAAKGRILFRGDQFQQSIPVLRRALELDQRNGDVWFWLGQAQLSIQDWPAAEATLTDYLAVFPDSSRGHLGLAKACVKLGQLERAERELQRVAELGTETPWLEKQVRNALAKKRERSGS
jgi:tetratricopeptide (TPR) repeat protein